MEPPMLQKYKTTESSGNQQSALFKPFLSSCKKFERGGGKRVNKERHEEALEEKVNFPMM